MSGKELFIHYNRLRGDHDGWTLWVWNAVPEAKGFALEPSGSDSFGPVFTLDLEAAGLENAAIGFLPRCKDWENKDAPDRVLERALPGELWLVEGDPRLHASPPAVSPVLTSALLDGPGLVRLIFNRRVDREFVLSIGPRAACAGRSFGPVSAEMTGVSGTGRAALLSFPDLGSPAPDELNSGLWEIRSGLASVPLRLGTAVYGPSFASDEKMGLSVRDGRAFIRVFAPFATRVEALFYPGPGPADPAVHPLRSAGRGLWEAVLPETPGRYWKMRVTSGGKVSEGLDPYAASVTAHDGLALASGDDSPVAAGPAFGLSDAVIYELNIRDFTIDGSSGARERGKYLGLAESGTVHPGLPGLRTGLDHLSELGVTAVHIMPFQDFENDEAGACYNWGYMTVNFNSPDGWYATGLQNGERVRECKAMVDALHKKGIKVIMDVVYNHTAETRDKAFNFNVLAKDYYYRTREDGSYWNGSGCGNEFRSEAPMGRKFIADSLLHWLTEYKVDGFRFDLMGLIDLDTVSEIVERLKAERPDVMIYGEPWAAGPTPAKGVTKGAQRSMGYAVFNDGLRDALKGGAFDASEQGYVQSGRGREAVMRGIMGGVDEFADSPLESVNYVSCHDNHTLWDRICLSAKDDSHEDRVRMAKLAQAVVLTSQGVPFIHSGEEFLRSKKGEGNSYNLPDEVNRIDWTLKRVNGSVFGFYRDLILMRRAHPAFRMTSAAAVRANLRFYEDLGLPVPASCIAYQLDGAAAGDGWSRILVLINPCRTSRQFALPPGAYEKAFGPDGACAGGRRFSSFMEVPAISLTVLCA